MINYRRQFQGILENLQNNIDIADRQFIETKDDGCLWQYYRLIEEMQKIKNHIIHVEEKIKDDYQ